ncbi:hypothetical protein CANCADRAFT_13627, partial [Tortispora caseinolytica NRRL Y-17796]
YGGYNRFGGYGGYGGYGMGQGGIGPDGQPVGPLGRIEQSTQATFQLLESVVGAVGGFAQMLESTYMATHSSFFAMMSVAEQMGHLRNSLGSILGIFAIMRWVKKLIATVTGRAPQPPELSSAEFQKFEQSLAQGGNRAKKGQARPSIKPLLMFLAAVVGFPYLLGKMVKAMASRQDMSSDPSQLEFCRMLYDFVPENPGVELELKKGDIVAILSKVDPMGNRSQWWRARSRDGRSGYVPSTYLEAIERKPQ